MAFHDRGAIVIDIPDKAATTVTQDTGSRALDAPVIDRLEIWPDLVLLAEFKLGFVDP